MAFFQRSPGPADEATLAGKIRATAISWDDPAVVYLNEAPMRADGTGTSTLCKPADRRCTRPAEGPGAYARTSG